MGILSKITRSIGKLFPGTGRHAAKRAATEANKFAQEAIVERSKLEDKTRRERLKAQKLAIRGLRSKRAAANYGAALGSSDSYGGTTIG